MLSFLYRERRQEFNEMIYHNIGTKAGSDDK